MSQTIKTKDKSEFDHGASTTFPGFEKADSCSECGCALPTVDDDYGWMDGNSVKVHVCRSCWLSAIDNYDGPLNIDVIQDNLRLSEHVKIF